MLVLYRAIVSSRVKLLHPISPFLAIRKVTKETKQKNPTVLHVLYRPYSISQEVYSYLELSQTGKSGIDLKKANLTLGTC